MSTLEGFHCSSYTLELKLKVHVGLLSIILEFHPPCEHISNSLFTSTDVLIEQFRTLYITQ